MTDTKRLLCLLRYIPVFLNEFIACRPVVPCAGKEKKQLPDSSYHLSLWGIISWDTCDII